MRVADVLRQGALALKKSGVEEFELDARLLLEHVLDRNRSELFLLADHELNADQLFYYHDLIKRREKRQPVAYILGEQEFWSLTFMVSPAVLIPRPETEFLLEQVFSLTKKNNFSKGKIIDLCCGSGIIATVLAKETGQMIHAADVSTEALQVARQNVARHEVKEYVHLVCSDLFSSFIEKEHFSLVVSNPPYVSHIDVTGNLAPEVCEYEPHLALDGGIRGLELIAVIRKQLEHVLLPGGQIFMEIGADQGQEVSAMFRSKIDGFDGFSDVEIIKDYAGRDRVLHAIKTKTQ